MADNCVKVRDKFWFFASRAHDDDIYFAKVADQSGRLDPVNPDDRLRYRSRITPAEGANMLGVSNVIMINSDGIPVPFSADARGYMESYRRMDRVMWSITGSGGFRCGNEEEYLAFLADHYPNVTGAFLDDLFGYGKDKPESFYIDIIRNIKEKINKCSRPMELWATCYTKAFDKYSTAIYDDIDGVTIWTWNSDKLVELEDTFRKYEELLPEKKKILGVYIYDYSQHKAIPLHLMEHQCELGLKWLKEGRIDGMIFLTNCVMGLGYPSDYWLRNWIDRVGDQTLCEGGH